MMLATAAWGERAEDAEEDWEGERTGRPFKLPWGLPEGPAVDTEERGEGGRCPCPCPCAWLCRAA